MLGYAALAVATVTFAVVVARVACTLVAVASPELTSVTVSWMVSPASTEPLLFPPGAGSVNETPFVLTASTGAAATGRGNSESEADHNRIHAQIQRGTRVRHIIESPIPIRHPEARSAYAMCGMPHLPYTFKIYQV